MTGGRNYPVRPTLPNMGPSGCSNVISSTYFHLRKLQLRSSERMMQLLLVRLMNERRQLKDLSVARLKKRERVTRLRDAMKRRRA